MRERIVLVIILIPVLLGPFAFVLGPPLSAGQSLTPWHWFAVGAALFTGLFLTWLVVWNGKHSRRDLIRAIRQALGPDEPDAPIPQPPEATPALGASAQD